MHGVALKNPCCMSNSAREAQVYFYLGSCKRHQANPHTGLIAANLGSDFGAFEQTAAKHLRR